MIRTTLWSAGAIMALCVALPASAQMVDGSFESQGASVGTYCYFGTDCPAGAWTGANGGGLQDETNGAWPGALTPAGAKYAFIQNQGYVSQIFNSVGGMFEVSWLVAGRPPGCCQGNQSYDVLLDGGTIFSDSTVTGQPFTARSSNPFSLAAGNHTLTFQGLNGNGDQTSFLDNVVVAGVPEPASWAMMILGFGGIGATLRHRRRQFALAA